MGGDDQLGIPQESRNIEKNRKENAVEEKEGKKGAGSTMPA